MLHWKFNVKIKLLLGTFGAVFLASAATAADLPVKAPAYSSAPAASSWSGFYLGGGIGFLSSFVNETSAIPAGGSSAAANSEPLNGVALRGNAFAGYNFQVTSRWVLGVEGDFGLTNQTTTFPGIAFPFPAAKLLRLSLPATALPPKRHGTRARAAAWAFLSCRKRCFMRPAARPGSVTRSTRLAVVCFAQATPYLAVPFLFLAAA